MNIDTTHNAAALTPAQTFRIRRRIAELTAGKVNIPATIEQRCHAAFWNAVETEIEGVDTSKENA